MNSKATIIILNWNGKDLLEKNLSSVLSLEYTNYDVLIVDNGSTDGSQKYIKKLQKKHKNLKFLQTGENLGYAGGNNKGIKKVLSEGKSKYIVMLNNDVRVDQDWLTNLISGFDDLYIGICTSKILLYHPYQQIVVIPQGFVKLQKLTFKDVDYHSLVFNEEDFKGQGELLTFPKNLSGGEIYYFAIPYRESIEDKLKVEFNGKGLKLFIGEKKYFLEKNRSLSITHRGDFVIQNAGSDFDEQKKFFTDRYLFSFNQSFQNQIVDAGCGAAMAIRTDLLKELGGFNDNYFMYFEDTELSYRFQRAGFTTKYIENAVCYHQFWGSSGGKISETQTFYGTRNRLWFIREYFGSLQFFYYYLRTAFRTLLFGIKAIINEDAKMFYKNYLRVLKEAQKRYK